LTLCLMRLARLPAVMDRPNYFSANLQNEIESFDTFIDCPIAEVQLGGFRLNRKIRAAGPGKRLHHGCVLF